LDTPDVPKEAILDQNGALAVDTTCRRCGYNLRGLREDGRCPECGTAIGLSTRGDLLRFADPEWVEKLARGVRFMLWGIAVSIAVGILGACLTGLAGGSEGISEAFNLVGSLLGVYGAWLLTAPDPSRIGEDRYVTARRIVRLGLIAGVVSHMLKIVITDLASASWAAVVMLGIPFVLLSLAYVAGEFAKFLYIEKLADRIPEPKLASFARFLRWAYSIGLAVLVLVGGAFLFWALASGGTVAALTTTATGSAPATQAVASRPAAAGLGVLMLGAACLFGVVMLAFGIMILVLYIQLGGHLRRQAEAARSTWARGATGATTASPIESQPE
jgi:hypothetical protein